MTRPQNLFSLPTLFNRNRHDRDTAATPASEPLPYLLENDAGAGSWQGKPIFDRDQVIAQLTTDWKIEGRVIRYGFLDAADAVGKTGVEYPGFSPFDAAQKAATRQAMELWDDLVPLHFIETRGNVDIALANTTTGPEQAWAYMPTEDGNPRTPQSNIWVADQQWTNGSLGNGGFGTYTLIHEIGHSLGLSHPGDYDSAADKDGDGVPDPIGYTDDAVYAQDTQQFTVMSYFPNGITGTQTLEPSLLDQSYAQTPLLHDIMAIQQVYGADPTTRRGNTVYFANSTAGNAVYDLEENPFPYLCVYDAGGNDTFDFSTAITGVFLDLRAGAFSSASFGYLPYDEAVAAMNAYNALKPEGVPAMSWNPDFYAGWTGSLLSMGAAKVEADTGVDGVTATMIRNISIAYNTVIENAVGGDSRDYLVGNDVANWLKGNGGDDVLNGLGGNDVLVGGKGADSFCFFDASGKDVILDFASGTDKIDLTAIDANIFTEVDEAFAFIGSALFGGVAGELRSWASWGGHFLAGDTDGDKVADFTIDLGVATVVMADLFF
ncbi:M10 family metallopeptidase C-terminal domain-containing protein [Allosphingosinicella deserti]|uniref:Peptidase metallopeptidase domain-containing protein n=1 Tax=Allosphingosinicella deserti TaxID=2116704 RepID=A0A2P7QVU6_9SPHN|nr:M10 family metallopeptidase C-terminal domain-containing protein [Sphingomonas deserti]PSJ42064.1 hypothetical protein C7I55_07405 [Sphingomonas deserti]